MMISDELIPLLQDAYARAAFGQRPSNTPHIRKKWKLVADYLLAGQQSEKSDRHALAVELHAVFLELGHRTEIMGRADYDPPLIGWRGVADWVIKNQDLIITPARKTPTTATRSKFVPQ